MIQKPLNEITADDLNELVTNAVPEGRNIDFKRDLCGNSDADKKEFLADVSSFANATGGDLLFGVDEADGVASAIPGLAGFDADATILRLEGSIRDGIDPRIPGVQFQTVDGFANGPVFIVRIPNSWAGPHMVTFKGTSRFYSRGSAGKFQLDVTEIRAAFDATGLLSKRITDWRTDRLGKIISGDGPFPLSTDSCVVVHIVPLTTFGEQKFAAMDLKAHNLSFPLVDTYSHSSRLNLDGMVNYRASDDERTTAYSYTQVFRSACIEAVSGGLLSSNEGSRFIPSIAYERDIIAAVQSHFQSLRQLGVEPPVLFMISLLGVKGAYMYLDPGYMVKQHPFDRDSVVIPEIIVSDFGADVAKALRPAFDMVWNACGLARSFNYNDQGEWAPRR